MIKLVVPPKVDVMSVKHTRKKEERKAAVSIVYEEIGKECDETAFV